MIATQILVNKHTFSKGIEALRERKPMNDYINGSIITKRKIFYLTPIKEDFLDLFKRLNSNVNISLFVFLYSLATKIPENIVAILEFKTAKLLNTNIKVIRKTVSFLKKEGDINFEGGIMKDLGINDKNKQLKNILCFTVEIFFMFFFLSELKWTITIQHLQEPIFFLTNEIFGGWMTIFKIYAATTGIIFSTFKREPICRLEWGQAFQQAFI